MPDKIVIMDDKAHAIDPLEDLNLLNSVARSSLAMTGFVVLVICAGLRSELSK